MPDLDLLSAYDYPLPETLIAHLPAERRDGSRLMALDRRTGKLRWKTAIGATATAGPAVAAPGGFPVAVYAVSADGMVVCLNPQTGKVGWGRNLREHTGKKVEDVFSTPTVVTTEAPTGSRRVVYIGAQLTNPNNGAKTAAVFRFEDELDEFLCPLPLHQQLLAGVKAHIEIAALRGAHLGPSDDRRRVCKPGLDRRPRRADQTLPLYHRNIY